MAKKMALIPADMAFQMQQQPYSSSAPAYNQLSLLDSQMKAILDNTTLSPEQRLQQYHNNLRRFEEIQNVEQPVPVRFIKQTQPEKEVADAPKLPATDSELLGTLSKTKRRGAKLLLDYLKHNPTIKWNDANELVYKGHRIPNSNFYDLVRDFSEDSIQQSPVRGWKEFSEALAQQNVPEAAIGNRKRLGMFHNFEMDSQEEDLEDELLTPKRKRSRRKLPNYGQGDFKWEALPRPSNRYIPLRRLREDSPEPTRHSERIAGKKQHTGHGNITWESL